MKKLLHMILAKIQAEKENPETELMIIESHLAGLSATVNALMYDAEQEFLKLYEKLQTLGSQTVELTEMLHTTHALADNNEQMMPLADLNDFAIESVGQLRSFQRDISDSLRTLDSGWAHLEKLSDLCTQAESMTRLLNDMHSKNPHSETPHEIISFHDTIKQQIDHVRQLSLTFHQKALNAMLSASQFCHMSHALERFGRKSTDTPDRSLPLLKKIKFLTRLLHHKTRHCLKKEKPESHREAQPADDSGALFATSTSAALKMAHKLEATIENTRFALSSIPDFSNRMALLLKQAESVYPLNSQKKHKSGMA